MLSARAAEAKPCKAEGSGRGGGEVEDLIRDTVHPLQRDGHARGHQVIAERKRHVARGHWRGTVTGVMDVQQNLIETDQEQG